LPFTTAREVSGSAVLTPKFVSIRHGSPRPRRCAGGVIRDVVNNIGGSRRWLITVMVQLTSTRLVVRKSVDDTHGAACSLCDSCASETMRVQNYAGTGSGI